MTGQELEHGCMSDQPKDIHYCLGYIAGVIDYHLMLQSLGTAPTVDFCLPDNLSIRQAAVEVMAYLSRAPQNSGFIAAPTVAMAMHAAYPCRAQPQKRQKSR